MNISSVLEALFDVGVASIDRDHDGLLRALEDLWDQGHASVDSEVFQDWIRGYAKQFADHVENEENWMLGTALSAAQRQAHEADHQRIKGDFALLQAGSKHGLKTARDVHKFLKVELFKHFIQFDAKLIPYAAAGAGTP